MTRATTNSWSWSPNGADTIWNWLENVNIEAGFGLGGYTDWRIPKVKELQSIVDYENFDPAGAQAFNNNNCSAGCTILTCSCTAAGFHWSSTTSARPDPRFPRASRGAWNSPPAA